MGELRAVSSRGLGRSPLKAQTRVRIPLPLCWESGTSAWGARPHRLSVRTSPFQGGETGSIPVGATTGQQVRVRAEQGSGRGLADQGTVAQLVRVPVCHTGGRGFEPRQSRCSTGAQEHRSARSPTHTKQQDCRRKRDGSQRPGGEIGRHAILRGWCRKASRFESAPGHV